MLRTFKEGLLGNITEKVYESIGKQILGLKKC